MAFLGWVASLGRSKVETTVFGLVPLSSVPGWKRDQRATSFAVLLFGGHFTEAFGAKLWGESLRLAIFRRARLSEKWAGVAL